MQALSLLVKLTLPIELKIDMCHKHPDLQKLGLSIQIFFVCPIREIRLPVNFSSGANFCKI